MIYVATRAGKRHAVSEDAVLVGTEVIVDVAATLTVPEEGFVCVADGVGGHRGGAEASRFVLEALAALENVRPDALRPLLTGVNERLIASAAEMPDMATTLTGFYACKGAFRLIHVGNTRAYVRQGRYLKQVTADHTTCQWLRSQGMYEAAEACSRSEITNCFDGGAAALLSRLTVSEIPTFSLALLTSDGVHEHIDLDTLETVLAGDDDYADKCEEIIRRAIDAGSEDDLTVVIICLKE